MGMAGQCRSLYTFTDSVSGLLWAQFVAPHNYLNSNIKDYWSQVTITNINRKAWNTVKITKCEWQTWSEPVLLGKMALIEFSDTGLPQTFNLKKILVSSIKSTVQQSMPVL